MRKTRRLRNNPGKEVPDNLLFTALRWETSVSSTSQASVAWTTRPRLTDLRTIYSKRLWDEHGIFIDLK
jgi:hypothetical protein